MFLAIRILCCLLIVCGGHVVTAASIGTQWEGLAHTIAGKVESFARANGGQLPPALDMLYTGVDAALLEEQIGGPISSKMIYFGEQRPQLETAGEELLAVFAFPINEDRRTEVGRYVIYRNGDGKIGSRWELEKVIQASVAKANVTLPFALTYKEKPIKPLYPEYGMHLLDDARNHGVPIEQAVEILEKHIDDVTNRRVKKATTWLDITAAATANPEPDPTSPLSVTTRTTPETLSTLRPVVASEQRVSTSPLLWLFGILALTVCGLLVWKRLRGTNGAR